MSINQHQFNILHDQYRDRLLNSMTAVVRDRDTAEDVTAAALAAAWQNLNQFRGESSLYTWFYSIALNEARNRPRRNEGVSLESVDRPDAKELTEQDMVAPSLERRESFSNSEGSSTNPRSLPASAGGSFRPRVFGQANIPSE